MALGYLVAQVNPGSVQITGRGTDDIDTALNDACDAALEDEDIDASEDAEAAVEAIRTAVAAGRAAQAVGNVLLRFDAAITGNQLVSALEAMVREVRGSRTLA